MCGICGVVSKDILRDRDFDAVRRMNSRMCHRGPDGAGEFVDADSNRLFLAMRRLSIIDLKGGWQPLHNETRTVSLVANGEIYNFVEIRAALEKAGHRFRTGSDCETIVHLYEEEGANCVQRLRGMFCFALWDARGRRLIIGRDRLGEKPVYLYEREGKIVFASEMKALLASGEVPFELDPVSVNQYLHYGWVPEPRTVLQGVRKLPPAHLLVVELDPWKVESREYWRFGDAPPVDGDPASLIRAELENIAGLIVRSEVPVGVALSGGLDSSAVAALAAKRYPGVLAAFSVGYKGYPLQDERKMARQFAVHIGMPFHEVEISVDEMVAFFPDLNYWRDDPIADIAGLGYYAVNRAARENGYPVLLQGHGGDELFWGYSWVVRAVKATRLKGTGRRPNWLCSLLEHLPKGLSKSELVEALYLFGGLIHGWKAIQPARNAPADQVVFYDLCDTYQIAVRAAYSTYHKLFAARLGDSVAADWFCVKQPWPPADLLIMRMLFGSYLLQNGIAQSDRLSMASSVELRLPLLDYKLVELIVGLQKRVPSYLLPAKSWLRDAVVGIVPQWVIDRPKRGFNPPVTLWINALKARYGDDLCSGYLTQTCVLDRQAARCLIEPGSRFGVRNDLAFKYMVLESWCRAMTGVQASVGH